MGFFLDLVPDRILQLGITETVLASWIIMALLFLFSLYLSPRFKLVPGYLQAGLELIYEAVAGLLELMMGEEGSRHLPLVMTLALFITASNLMAILPGVTSPSEDINGPLAWALIVFFYLHFYSLREKGLIPYLKGYVEPSWLLLPINLLGELAKPISLSFRLFGNIFGGGLVVAVVAMFFPWVVPVPLAAWFNLFIGLLHAFIFTMLTVAYLAVELTGHQGREVEKDGRVK